MDLICLNFYKGCNKTLQDTTHSYRYAKQIEGEGRLQIFQGLILGFMILLLTCPTSRCEPTGDTASERASAIPRYQQQRNNILDAGTYHHMRELGELGDGTKKSK